MKQYLEETAMLNYRDESLQSLVNQKGWKELDEYHKIGSIYDFVQNKIYFGYNKKDELSASEVLSDGFGQCNTKASLLMALLRAVGIPCRLHGFEVIKDFQKGALPNLVYYLAPSRIVHTWVEVYFENRWIALEGVIMDEDYLRVVQGSTKEKGEYKYYAIATSCIENPEINWTGKDTYIQKEAVTKDLGYFDTPDDFFDQYAQKLSAIKNLLYSNIATRWMTRKVNKIRNSKKGNLV